LLRLTCSRLRSVRDTSGRSNSGRVSRLLITQPAATKAVLCATPSATTRSQDCKTPSASVVVGAGKNAVAWCFR